MIARRHDLLVVPPPIWSNAVAGRVACPLSPGQADLLSDWANKRWPVMVRRPSQDKTAGISVGVPLPPSAGKARIALTLPVDAPVEQYAPVLLEDAVRSAPVAWRETITSIIGLGRTLEANPRVFGALLWEHLTGLVYLSTRSDIDLLWAPKRSDLSALLDGLRALDDDAPMTIDGEIILEDGGGVSWRELDRARADASAEVVVKSMNGLALRRVGAILGSGTRSAW